MDQPTNPTPKVLVVEDEELLRDAITRKLKLSNIESVSCSSGEDAINQIQSMDSKPAAVWLDYRLEDIDGLEFMQRLKSIPGFDQIPVIVVSNSADQENIHSMLALGVKKYLLKAEYRLEDIIEDLKEIINQVNE